MHRRFLGIVLGLVALLVSGGVAAAQPKLRVVASGLDNPRGLAIGPGGAIYVAEAGRGGTSPCAPSPEGEERYAWAAPARSPGSRTEASTAS